MIIVKLMGGLGNQMFQYAAARRLALRHGSEVVFDGSYFREYPAGDTPRKYELHHFPVVARFGTPLEIAEMSGACRSLWQRTQVGVRRATGLARYPVRRFSEPEAHFCPEVLNLPDNIYLAGYWHSERYFADVAQPIHEELTVRADPVGKNLEVAERIGATTAVAVHFRRGDYVTSDKTSAFHGVLPLEYYRRAIEILCERINRPHLFVFSDDSQWVRQHVSLPVPFEIVDHNPPEQGYEDLRLMSLCSHAIIANSSFSWWGAWLNRNPGKLVVAPRRWFVDDGMNSSDLTPPDWLRVA